MSNQEVLDLCEKLGIGARSHSSSIVEAQGDRVRRRAQKDGLVKAAPPEEAKPVEEAKPKNPPVSTKKAPPKKKAEPKVEKTEPEPAPTPAPEPEAPAEVVEAPEPAPAPEVEAPAADSRGGGRGPRARGSARRRPQARRALERQQRPAPSRGTAPRPADPARQRAGTARRATGLGPRRPGRLGRPCRRRRPPGVGHGQGHPAPGPAAHLVDRQAHPAAARHRWPRSRAPPSRPRRPSGRSAPRLAPVAAPRPGMRCAAAVPARRFPVPVPVAAAAPAVALLAAVAPSGRSVGAGAVVVGSARSCSRSTGRPTRRPTPPSPRARSSSSARRPPWTSAPS